MGLWLAYVLAYTQDLIALKRVVHKNMKKFLYTEVLEAVVAAINVQKIFVF